MTNPTPPKTLTVPATVHLLCAELGETPAVWTERLVNWRRPTRQGQAPFKHVQGTRPQYLDSEIHRYIAKMKLEKGAVQADPMDSVPNATATVIRNQESRLLVQINWNDVNTSGTLVLSAAAAEDLAQSLTAAIGDLQNLFNADFEADMGQDLENLAFRSSRATATGELPTLEQALEKA